MAKAVNDIRDPYKNHEWIYDIKLPKLLADMHKTLDFLDIEHTIELSLEEYNKGSGIPMPQLFQTPGHAPIGGYGFPGIKAQLRIHY